MVYIILEASRVSVIEMRERERERERENRDIVTQKSNHGIYNP